MSTTDKPTSAAYPRTIIPFTGGLMVIYAFFWPEEYGHWLGTIVRAFRAAAGI
jgi:hypothetical protein